MWPLQRIVEAIFYLTKNGLIRRDLPEGFPPWQTVYYYFRKWSKDDTCLLIANELSMLHRQKAGKNPLPTVAIIDAQSVKNSATATQQIGFDGGKLSNGRKRFPIVDTMGHLLGRMCDRLTSLMVKRGWFVGKKLSISIRYWTT
nr:transposase [Spirosoma oryzae]